MVASLGGEFRRKARKGGARVAVARGNPGGSLKVTDSRVLEAGDLTAALMRISLSWLAGFLGLFSMCRGGRSGARDTRERKGHVGSEEHRAHEILADAGPHAAVVLARCKDQPTRQMAAAAAKDAKASWDGPLAAFLAAADPGPAHDRVREAVGEPSPTKD
jgi:hypothetical protein